jgi:hypothetical protein
VLKNKEMKNIQRWKAKQKMKGQNLEKRYFVKEIDFWFYFSINLKQPHHLLMKKMNPLMRKVGLALQKEKVEEDPVAKAKAMAENAVRDPMAMVGSSKFWWRKAI